MSALTDATLVADLALADLAARGVAAGWLLPRTTFTALSAAEHRRRRPDVCGPARSTLPTDGPVPSRPPGMPPQDTESGGLAGTGPGRWVP